MLKKFLATAMVLAVVGTANATITAWVEQWNSGTLGGDGGHAGEEFVSYRIWVQLSDTPPGDPQPGPDDWTASGLNLPVTGGVYYDHATLDANPPNPMFWNPPFEFFDSEYTSYYTSPGDYPNTTFTGGIVGFAGPIGDSDTLRQADWFDTLDIRNPEGSTADFVLAQFTILPTSPDWFAEGLLQYAAANTGGQLFDLPIFVPEPATLAALALGGLALIRRR